MKKRILAIIIILALSLGLATAALAAANSIHPASIMTESNQTLSPNLLLPSSPNPLLPDGSTNPRISALPDGAAGTEPQQPTLLGDWDSQKVNFPRVLQDGSQYRMWYDGAGNSNWAMGLAVSTNGITWTKSASNPVLKPGAIGQWDDFYRGQSTILKDGAVYKMWFSGGPTSGPWQTGYSTSTNGVDWNLLSGNPVLKVGALDSWEEQEADGPAVIKDGGVYKMWYHGCDLNYTKCSIGYATSPDGKVWTKYAGNPVITGTVEAYDAILVFPTVVKNGNTYYMWYTGNDSNFNYSGVYLATSEDGIHWTKDNRSPVLKTGWDGGLISGQSVSLASSTYTLWLRSGNGASYGLGYATSSDGVNWQMYTGNPVLKPGASPGLQITVNYAHDWVTAQTVPNVPITITVAGKNWIAGQTDESGQFNTSGSSWHNPKSPDIAPGDSVTAIADGMQTAVDPVGTITGQLDAAADTISGTIQAPFSTTLTVRCEVWVKNGPSSIVITGVPANGGSYSCDFGAEGWDILPGQQVAVRYFEPDGDSVINVFELPWMRVNYADNWVGGDYPAGHTMSITVTNSAGSFKATTQAVSASGSGWNGDGFDTKNPWSPSQPDIQPGDWVYFKSDDGYSHSLQVGVINGEIDTNKNSISGSIYADWYAQTLDVVCSPWGGPKTASEKTSTAGPNGDPPYSCQWDPATEWSIQPGQDLAVMYLQPDGDRVINVFRLPDLNLYLHVNYGDDWIEGNYEGGHTVWLTVTQSDGTSVIATASGQTSIIPWWDNDQTGFSTNYNVSWDSGSATDMQAGDWVYGQLDNGYKGKVQLGQITGQIDLGANSISGQVQTPWYTQTMDIECYPWGAPGSPPNKTSKAGPNGDPSYTCQWDPETEWRIMAGEDVGVAYNGPDGTWVANVFRIPAPQLWIQTWSDGSPSVSGNLTLNIQRQNNGEATADDLVITDTLAGGMVYLSDTSSVLHTGNGTPGHPLVWHLGSLAAGANTQFQLFVAVTAPTSSVITNTAQIGTSTLYSQKNTGDLSSQWSGQVQPNDTRLRVDKWAWTGNPVPGSNYVYNINVCNQGSTGSTSLTLTDTLPLSTTLVSWWGQYAGWTKVASPAHTLVVKRPSIPGGWCGEVYVRVKLDSKVKTGTKISNTATIAASNNLDLQNVQSTAWVYIDTSHYNLSIEKNGEWGRPVPGGALEYQLTYRNNGNISANPVLITSTLPANTTFTGSWYYDSSGQHIVTPTLVVQGKYVVWKIGKLDNGYYGSLNIHLDIDAAAEPGAVLTHTMRIKKLPVEDNYDDNILTWVDTLASPGPNLRVDTQNYKWNGDNNINYKISLSNLGATSLSNFWFTDTYPLSTNFDGDWNIEKGKEFTITVDADKHQLIFWGKQLDPGDISMLRFSVNLDESSAGKPGLIFKNTIVAPIPGDVYPADNEDEVTAFSGPDLYVEKSLVGGIPAPGSVITYSLKFGNAQQGSAGWWSLQGNAWLTDTLPSDVEFLSAKLLYCGAKIWCDVTPKAISGHKLVWKLWQLGVTEHNEFRVAVRIPNTGTVPDTLLNQVQIASDQPENDVEPYTANNSASLTVEVKRYVIYLPHVRR
jgi:uncharacterized repeat protein (TIGR01451 family)